MKRWNSIFVKHVAPIYKFYFLFFKLFEDKKTVSNRVCIVDHCVNALKVSFLITKESVRQLDLFLLLKGFLSKCSAPWESNRGYFCLRHSGWDGAYAPTKKGARKSRALQCLVVWLMPAAGWPQTRGRHGQLRRRRSLSGRLPGRWGPNARRRWCGRKRPCHRLPVRWSRSLWLSWTTSRCHWPSCCLLKCLLPTTCGNPAWSVLIDRLKAVLGKTVVDRE